MPRSSPRVAGVLRVGAVAVAAVVVAEGAVWLLRPRDPVPDPVAVSEADHFSSAELERAGSYRSGQRALLLAGLAVEGGVLLLLALGRPRFARAGLERLGIRPLAGGAAGAAAISAAVTAAGLPVAAVAHERAVEVGISTQGWGGWLADAGKGAAISALLAAAGGAILIGLLRRFPRVWWVAGAGVATGASVLFVWVAPVALEPLFNDFERLPDGRTRTDVLSLGRRAGVEIGEVYRVDASRRTTALNAYVAGIGSTKRVVLYDTLLEDAERDALRSVLAHELAHAAHSDIWRGLAYVALVAPLGMLFVSVAGRALARRSGADPASPGALPAYALTIAIATLVLGAVGNQLSRDVEAEADAFALRLTGDPAALVELQERLARRNLADPDPPGWYEAVFATHPPTVERIGMALAYERERSLPEEPVGER